jgi:hypothetical protein
MLLCVICTLIINSLQLSAQKNNSQKKDHDPMIKMTSFAFGGTGVLFSKVNGQATVMAGGRGSAVFNNRFTFGGGGWGMPQGVGLATNKKDTFGFFKFGYGGLEFGYIFYQHKGIHFGSNLMVAYGAGFKETIPKSKESDVKLFPVFEPSIYSQISLGELLRLDVGLKYRYVAGNQPEYLSTHSLSGFSWYVALLAGSCKCGKASLARTDPNNI